jgi:hypothetical protein
MLFEDALQDDLDVLENLDEPTDPGAVGTRRLQKEWLMMQCLLLEQLFMFLVESVQGPCVGNQVRPFYI